MRVSAWNESKVLFWNGIQHSPQLRSSLFYDNTYNIVMGFANIGIQYPRHIGYQSISIIFDMFVSYKFSYLTKYLIVHKFNNQDIKQREIKNIQMIKGS